MRYFIVILILITTLLIGCKSNSTEPNYNEKYTGITNTGPDGPTPIGNVDVDDWYYSNKDSVFDNHIKFSFKVYPAYPNPTNRYFTLMFQLPKDDSVKIWLDDPGMNKSSILLNSFRPAGIYSIKIDLLYGDSLLSRPNSISRLYIDVESNNSYPKVHGDVQYQK